MKNKFLLFIMVASLLAGIVNTAAANTDDVPDRAWVLESTAETEELTGDNLANYTLLSYLRIIQEEKKSFNGGETVLRGYAAETAAYLATEELYKAESSPYSDVLMTNKFIDGVYTAKSLGITASTKKFNPLKAVTPDDAAEFIVKALGLNNAYPIYSIPQIVQNLKLLKGIDINQETITKNDLMKIIVNALNSNSVTRKYLNGTWVIEINKDESILEERENIILIKGIVTADGSSSLFDEESIAAGKIEINRNLYDINYRPKENLTGKSVIAYADSENDNFIIYLTKNDKLNTVTEISKKDVIEISENAVHYLNQNNARKRASIDNGAKVICNNLYAGNSKQFDFKDFDTIILIDNDGDNDVDVFHVLKYNYYFVDKIAEYSKKLSMYGNDTVISLGEKECAMYSVKSAETGEELNFSDIKQYDVLSVLEAEKTDGKKIYTITVSRDKIDAVLKATDNDEEKKYIIDDKEYVLSDEYEKYLSENKSDPKPIIGENYIFYISHDGKIVMSKQDADKFSYAYLLRAYDLTEEEDVKIKVYTITGEICDFTMSDKVKVYNENNLKGVKKKKAEVYSELFKTGVVKNQMIAYKTDGEGKIKEIAPEYDMTGKIPGTLDYPIIRNAKVGGDGVKTENGRLYEYILGCGYYVPSRTTVITVPNDPDKFDNQLNFSIDQASIYGKDYYFDNNSLIVYNADSFYGASFCVSENSGGGVNMDRFLRAYMISGVSTTINQDDEPCMALKYIDEDGEERSAVVTSDAKLSTPTSGQFYGVSGGIDDLKKGDIVQMDISAAGITGVRILLKSNNIGDFRTEYQSDSVVTNGNGQNTFSQLGIMYGEVKDISTSALVMNVSPTGSEEYTHMVRLDNNTAYDSCAYTLYERKSGKVMSIKHSEIQKGDEVFLRKRFHHAIDIFIIRD